MRLWLLVCLSSLLLSAACSPLPGDDSQTSAEAAVESPSALVEQQVVVRFNADSEGLRVAKTKLSQLNDVAASLQQRIEEGRITPERQRDLEAAAALAEVMVRRRLEFRPLIRLDAATLARVPGLSDLAATWFLAVPAPDAVDVHPMFALEGGEPIFNRAAEDLLAELNPATNTSINQSYVRLRSTKPFGIESSLAPFDKAGAHVQGATPNFADLQVYRNVLGMNLDFLTQYNARGAGVRVSDCEFAWIADHEDRPANFTMEPGQSYSAFVQKYYPYYGLHGIATVGEIAAADNGFGMTGLAPDTALYTYLMWSNEEGERVETGIAKAIAESGAGDIVMLELQTSVTPNSEDYAPMEIEPAVWQIVKAGTDAGVIVIAAAGNAQVNLDTNPRLAAYRSWGDSGAIIVGAGHPTTDAAHRGLQVIANEPVPDTRDHWGSTFGSRVNVQGWGLGVATLGYGDLFGGRDMPHSYTSTFGGTSGATPIVTGAAAAIQSYARAFGLNLSPADMRAVLVAHGAPQVVDPHNALTQRHIGPFPQVTTTMDAISPIFTGHVYVPLIRR